MFIVSIESRDNPGSAYYTVATVFDDQVAELEESARRAGLEAIVRRSDDFAEAVKWLRTNTSAGAR